jgi:hypothetical protein
MRNISFSMTTKAFLDGTKSVTRRLGWMWLYPGARLMACKQVMGLKPGEKIQELGVIEVLKVTRERLDEISVEDVQAEGFNDMTPEQFVAGFCKAMKCKPDTTVTRIAFRRVT